jgi:ABC-2 type transport system ATP-binding protein
MRQRLAIAATLVKEPEVLIFDEPANGLDPAGIVEVRELIRSLGAEGRTVFVSSHILSEIQQVADHVAILARGRALRAGPVSEVLALGGAVGLLVRLDDLAAGQRALTEAGIGVEADGQRLRVAVPPDDGARVTRVLAERGLYVSELRPDEADLESVFLELTKDEGL